MRLADVFTGGGYSKAVNNAQKVAQQTTGEGGYDDAQNKNLQFARDTAAGWNAQAQGDARAQGLTTAQRAAFLANTGASAVDKNNMYDMAKSLNDARRDFSEKQVEEQMQSAANREDDIASTIGDVGNSLKENAALVPELEKKYIESRNGSENEELVKRVTAGEARDAVEKQIRQRKAEKLYNSPVYRGTRWLGNILFGTNFPS